MRGKGSDGMWVVFALDDTEEGPIPALRQGFHTANLRLDVLLVLNTISDTKLYTLLFRSGTYTCSRQIEYIRRKRSV